VCVGGRGKRERGKAEREGIGRGKRERDGRERGKSRKIPHKKCKRKQACLDPCNQETLFTSIRSLKLLVYETLSY
jgi:hypothetical protein